MIKVYIKKTDEGRVLQVTVKGHAGFDEPGKDIVCSAVSALTIGAVNSVEKLLKIDLKPEDDQSKGGYLSWDVPMMDDYNIDDRLQLLMKAMVESILMIEEDYSQYIQVEIQTPY